MGLDRRRATAFPSSGELLSGGAPTFRGGGKAQRCSSIRFPWKTDQPPESIAGPAFLGRPPAVPRLWRWAGMAEDRSCLAQASLAQHLATGWGGAWVLLLLPRMSRHPACVRQGATQSPDMPSGASQTTQPHAWISTLPMLPSLALFQSAPPSSGRTLAEDDGLVRRKGEEKWV